MDCCPPSRLLFPWDFPSKNTGVGCHAILQRIFPTQGSNPNLQHWKQIGQDSNPVGLTSESLYHPTLASEARPGAQSEPRME